MNNLKTLKYQTFFFLLFFLKTFFSFLFMQDFKESLLVFLDVMNRKDTTIQYTVELKIKSKYLKFLASNSVLCTISISFEKHQQRNKVKLIYNHPPTLYEYSKVFRTYTKCTEKRHNRVKLTNREARYSGNVNKPKINNQNNTKNTEIAKFPCLRIFGLKLQRKLKKIHRNCTYMDSKPEVHLMAR